MTQPIEYIKKSDKVLTVHPTDIPPDVFDKIIEIMHKVYDLSSGKVSVPACVYEDFAHFMLERENKMEFAHFQTTKGESPWGKGTGEIVYQTALENRKRWDEEILKAKKEQIQKDADICINIKKTVATKSAVDFVGIAAEGTASICAKEIRHQIIQ